MPSSCAALPPTSVSSRPSCQARTVPLASTISQCAFQPGPPPPLLASWLNPRSHSRHSPPSTDDAPARLLPATSLEEGERGREGRLPDSQALPVIGGPIPVTLFFALENGSSSPVFNPPPPRPAPHRSRNPPSVHHVIRNVGRPWRHKETGVCPAWRRGSSLVSTHRTVCRADDQRRRAQPARTTGQVARL